MNATSKAINVLYSQYLEDPESGRDTLLAEVHRLAKRSFHDDDQAQEFTIIAWQRLSNMEGLQLTFGTWIWCHICWRRIDSIRGRHHYELPLPRLMDDSGELLTDAEIFDLMALQAKRPALAGRIAGLGRISDPFVFRVAQGLIAGYTQNEFALRMGCKPSTLWNRLLRYRNQHRSTDTGS